MSYRRPTASQEEVHLPSYQHFDGYGVASGIPSGDIPSWKRNTRKIIERFLPIMIWVAIGCGVTMYMTTTSKVVDFTHGDGQRHAITKETDLLSSCKSTNVDGEETVGKKNTHWFLGGPDPELLLTALPSIQSIDELPKEWDWRNYNNTGISLVTSIQNQMVPRPCGSCWAFSTISALSDRIRIAEYKKYGKIGPEIVLSVQVLLDCGMRSFGSCSGGDPRYAHQWIYENGIVDQTCNPYIASHPSWFDVNGECAKNQCRHCKLNGECEILHNPKTYHISEYGTLNATNSKEFELEAMNEIYHRGPIVVSMYSHSEEYIHYKGGFVLQNDSKFPGTTHVVNLIGWGVDDAGVKYWIARNSDGTNWGEDGFFRVERGVNAYNLEKHGAWAVPIV